MLPPTVFLLGNLCDACLRAFDENGAEQIAIAPQGQSVKRSAGGLCAVLECGRAVFDVRLPCHPGANVVNGKTQRVQQTQASPKMRQNSSATNDFLSAA
jgi:hypothetical protein